MTNDMPQRDVLTIALHHLDMACCFLCANNMPDIPTLRKQLKRRIKDRCLRAASVAFFDELMSWEEGRRIGLEDFQR